MSANSEIPHHNLSNLELEVEVPTEGLPNLVQNPSGAKGAWFWLTAVSSTAISANGTSLTFTTTPSQACRFVTDFMPVTAGKYVAARFEITSITSGHNVKVRFDWYDASGALVSWSSQSVGLSAIGVNYVPAQQVPTGITQCKARFDFYDGASNPSAGASITFTRAMVTWTDSSSVYSVRTNLVRNPSFETNVTGWAGNQRSTSTTQAYVGTQSMRMHRTSDGLISVSTDHAVHPIPVTPGDSYSAGFMLFSTVANRSVTTRLVWLNSSGAEIGGAASTLFSVANAWVQYGASGTAPTGAAYAVLRVEIANVQANEYHYLDAAWMFASSGAVNGYFDGSTVASGFTYAWTGTAHASTSTETSATGAFNYSEPHGWLNILGSAYSIGIERVGLDVGTMTIGITNPNLDPALTDDLRPGKKIRLVAASRSVYEGKIKNAIVDYQQEKANRSKRRTVITLIAVDVLATGVNRKESRGVAAIASLPYLLEGKGIPWRVNGSGDQLLTAPVIVSANADASIIDQVAITRDSALGYAWVDRENILNVYDAANMNPANVITFTDDPTNQNLSYIQSYSAIDVDFDTERCINEVTVKWLRYNKAQGTSEEITYGPYRDQNSIDTWGAFSAEFTIHGASESPSSIATFAANVLAANSTPERRCKSLSYPVKDGDSMIWAAALDLYTAVAVVYGNKIVDSYRITSISHAITPDKWQVTYGFEVSGSVAAPQVTPAPPKTAAGPPHASRYRSTDLNVTDNTWTLITYDTPDGTGNNLVEYSSGVWTVPTAGVYQVAAICNFAGNTTNRRGMRLNKNNGTLLAEVVSPAGTTSLVGLVLSETVRLAEGDTLRFEAFQNSGVTLALNGGQKNLHASIYRLGD